MSNTEKTSTEIINELGGTCAVARIFGIKAPSVSDWKEFGIPRARMMFLEVKYPHLFASKKSKKSASRNT